jgi:thiol reductant ABC exporter CydC subunit
VLAGGGAVLLVGFMLPSAGLVLLVALAVAATLVPWLTRTAARRGEASVAALRGELSTAVVDLVDGAPDLIAYGAAPAQLARTSEIDAELTARAGAAASTAGLGAGSSLLLGGLAVWGVLLLGVPAVHAGLLDGVLLAVIVLTPLAAFEAVSGLPAAAQALEQVRRCAGRVFEVLDAPEPVAEPDPARAVPDAPHHLRVRGLVVQRVGAVLPALQGVDLDLPPGHRVAVVGASGAGKSTLAAVLLRFVPYQAGSVTLDGVELASAPGDAVRSVVGLAGQDAHVFDTTIRENLRLARPDATDDDLWTALSAARLADWVGTLPLGLDTHVGQHGAQISGGQRQRLSLARALLADFPVLILDEPGEHLDTETADALTADLLEVTEGRSTILVTHRLTGLEAVDEILVLDHGLVVERGTHPELLAAGGAYADLWSAEQEQD